MAGAQDKVIFQLKPRSQETLSVKARAWTPTSFDRLWDLPGLSLSLTGPVSSSSGTVKAADATKLDLRTYNTEKKVQGNRDPYSFSQEINPNPILKKFILPTGCRLVFLPLVGGAGNRGVQLQHQGHILGIKSVGRDWVSLVGWESLHFQKLLRTAG